MESKLAVAYIHVCMTTVENVRVVQFPDGHSTVTQESVVNSVPSASLLRKDREVGFDRAVQSRTFTAGRQSRKFTVVSFIFFCNLLHSSVKLCDSEKVIPLYRNIPPTSFSLYFIFQSTVLYSNALVSMTAKGANFTYKCISLPSIRNMSEAHWKNKGPMMMSFSCLISFLSLFAKHALKSHIPGGNLPTVHKNLCR